LDNVEVEKQELAFAREQDQTDKNIRGISLALGSLPTAGVMVQLLKATRGYKTGTLTPAAPPPPTLPQIIQNLIDQGIQDITGLVNWIIHNAPDAIPAAIKTVQIVEKTVEPFIQNLIDAGVNDANSVLKYLGVSSDSTVPSPPPTSWTSGPYNSFAEAQAAAGPNNIVSRATQWYVVPNPAARGPS
jgi:hypothetical protein